MAEAAADPNGVDLEDEADGSADDGLNTGTFGQLENSMSIANSESQGRDRSKTVYDEHEMRSWVNHRSNSCSANMDSNEPERHRTIQFLEPIVTGSMEAKYFERGLIIAEPMLGLCSSPLVFLMGSRKLLKFRKFSSRDFPLIRERVHSMQNLAQMRKFGIFSPGLHLHFFKTKY